MEFKQIQTFVTITQLHSFTKAAQKLGYSQSAITVQIQHLEEELGVQLFDRMKRTVILTTQGQQFLEYAEKILYDVKQAKKQMEPNDELCGTLHVGTLESLCNSKFPFITEYLYNHHPHMKLKITTGTPNQLIDMMDRNHLDLIWILDRQRYHTEWIKVFESQEPIVFVASPASHLAHRESLVLEDLLDEPFFLTEKNENYRKALDHFLEQKNRILSPFLEISNTEFLIQTLQKNKGISYLPYFAVKNYVQNEQLTILNVTDFNLSMYSQILYHKNKYRTQEMDAFIQLAAM